MQWKHVTEVRRLLDAEIGTIYKDWGGRLPIALIYANTYYVGMSSLAVHALYRLFNDRADVVCERVFWNKQRDRQATSLESQRPLSDFAVLAFTLSYEIDYFNAVELLRRAGIPLFAGEREATQPLLIAGGPAVSTNPEPLALIFDAFAIGEGEAIIPSLADALWETLGDGREVALAALARVPGIYVPALASSPVSRQWVRELDLLPAVTQIYNRNSEFADRTLIEIARGCGRGCRFCLAGYTYRPMREVRPETVLKLASEGLKYRDKVGLVSAAVSDYSCIDEIALALRRIGARVTVSSMRVDPISEPLIRALAESGTRTLTIAPEAGSWGVRQSANKPQTDEQILAVVELAARYGFAQLKLYFMVGQPGEGEDDVEAIADLAMAARARFPRNLVINATPYVPKAHTPFQWAAMAAVETLEERIRYLEQRLASPGLIVRSDSPAWAAVEGVLARGDRRLGSVLARMRHTSLAAWRRALVEEGLSQSEYLHQREPGEPLPWSVVNPGVSEEYLKREWQRAQRGELTHPCPPTGCRQCGACDEAWAFRQLDTDYSI
jgi:radical SAM superfamily enzyme YgiQ (UPF0313 family)